MESVGFVALCVGLCVLHLNMQTVRARSLRSDDASLVAVVDRLSSTVLALEAKLTSQEAKLTSQEATITNQGATITSQGDRVAHLEAENQRRVAFSVFIADALKRIPASAGAIVPFGAGISNVGHAFNTATSVFTCPFPGDYFFAISIDVSADYADVSLRKNGAVMVYADKDDTVSTHISASAVLSLKAGDTVTVVQDHSTGNIDVGRDCTFTGFLVK